MPKKKLNAELLKSQTEYNAERATPMTLGVALFVLQKSSADLTFDIKSADWSE